MGGIGLLWGRAPAAGGTALGWRALFVAAEQAEEPPAG